MPRSLPLIGLMLTLLAGCATTPSVPDYVPLHYREPLSDVLLRDGFRLSMTVPHPERLRFGSVTSRRPFYGMLSPTQAPGIFGSHQPPVVQQVLDIDRALTHELTRQIAKQPRLAAGLRASGKARLDLSIERLGMFGMDIGNRACQLTVMLKAQLHDSAGTLRWTSGFVASPVSDQFALPCDDLLTRREAMAAAIEQVLQRASAELVLKM